jgi:hypothetical protein
MSTRTTLILLGVLLALGAVAVITRGPGGGDRSREHALVFPGLVAGDVQVIKAARAGGELLLARDGAAWKLGASREPADGAAAERFLADVAGLRVSAVVSKNAAKQAGYETTAELGAAVRLEGAGGKTLAAFLVGKRGPDGVSCYLRREGASEVLLVASDLRSALYRPDESWRAPPQAAVNPAPEKPAGKP